MSVQTLKTAILELLKEKGDGRSFAELSGLPGFKGQLGLEFGNSNVFAWFHCSPEAVAAIKELLDEKKIILREALPVLYHVDGSIPARPVGDPDRTYKKAHWWPAQIIKGKAF